MYHLFKVVIKRCTWNDSFVERCFQNIVRGRPFDIRVGGRGGGAGLFSKKKILSLVLKEKNNLSLKRVKKKLSLKRAK